MKDLENILLKWLLLHRAASALKTRCASVTTVMNMNDIVVLDSSESELLSEWFRFLERIFYLIFHRPV